MSAARRRLSTLRLVVVVLVVAASVVVLGQTAGARSGPADDPLRAAGDQEGKVQVVKVLARTPEQRTRVIELGLDATEHADATGVEVVLHGADDARVLREAGFRWTVSIADLEQRVARNAAKDRAYAASTAQSPLPSGRTSYRDLADFNAEMDRLARRYPRLVEPLTLENRSVEGRRVRGIEITRDAADLTDGKPVFLMLGAHHAREWPSAEHAMEFAYDLLENYRTDDRARRTMSRVRTIVVPVVNVDGYVVSREAEPLGDFSQFDYEMKRKNCSISEATPAPVPRWHLR